MDGTDIALTRLANQRISSLARDPVDAVESLGALQAQAYNDALWAVGLRCRDATQSDVERLIEEKRIVRTWSMRGTWHFVPPSEVRWMLSLYREEKVPSYQRRNGLTEAIVGKGLAMIPEAFKAGKALTYDDIGRTLARSGIAELRKPDAQRHIIRRAGRAGIICFAGQVRGKPAFQLLDGVTRETGKHERDASLSKFARAYFTSHGPATVRDFAWWSGLGMSDASRGLDSVNGTMKSAEMSGETYWMPKRTRRKDRNAPSFYLLPSFDEYLIAYKDRDAVLDPKYYRKVINGSTLLFKPMMVYDGRIIGTWRRREKGRLAEITLSPFSRLDGGQLSGVREAAERLGRFLGRDVSVRR